MVDISVVLCTYNGERWVAELLDSIAAQRRLPDELVVQDDASTDGTADIVREFARRAPFEVRLELNEHRLGSTDNFAAALARSRGRFVALADQDDVWYPNKLEILVAELELDPTITMAFSDADLIGEDGRVIGRRLWDTRLVGRILRGRAVVSEELFARRALTTGCTMVVRRRAITAALPFPPELESDVAPMRHDRWLSLVSAAVGTARALPEPLLAFRVHPAQETGVLLRPDLRRALGGAAVRAIRRPAWEGAEGHRDRAAQLDAAAGRADDLGDFEEARTLRAIADHHRSRARRKGNARERVSSVLSEARAGGYRHEPFGWAAVAADVVRAARPESPASSDSDRVSTGSG
jgi:hypothetical protein